MSSARLSVGDAIVVIALLLFILAWFGGVAYGIRTLPPSVDLSGFAIVVLIVWLVPPIWAGSLVYDIVVR